MKYLDSLELLYINLLRGKEKKGMRIAFCKKKSVVYRYKKILRIDDGLLIKSCSAKTEMRN